MERVLHQKQRPHITYRSNQVPVLWLTKDTVREKRHRLQEFHHLNGLLLMLAPPWPASGPSGCQSQPGVIQPRNSGTCALEYGLQASTRPMGQIHFVAVSKRCALEGEPYMCV
eukprot:796428-Amphidinium_carterae.1